MSEPSIAGGAVPAPAGLADLNALERELRDRVRDSRALLVAYSGGIDSALVLKIAHDELGERALGVTADSPALPRHERDEAVRIAATIGARHELVATAELANPDYASNPPDRCYFCKSTLYHHVAAIARREGIATLANGTNRDDLGDYRPGLRAADEFKVVSPLRDAGLGKSEVRALARRLGLEIWDKPASPCLASRIPYGSAVTVERLAMIERAESYLSSLGIRTRRVRHFGALARIEVRASRVAWLTQRVAAVAAEFRRIGFAEIEIAEFRSGALNDALS